MVRCRLRIFMAERRWNIADVVRETGLPRTFVNALYWETAKKVDLEGLEILCRTFDCDIQDLFYLESNSMRPLNRPAEPLLKSVRR